jgi:ABC-type polysaccharide/polyol phosphate export permease
VEAAGRRTGRYRTVPGATARVRAIDLAQRGATAALARPRLDRAGWCPSAGPPRRPPNRSGQGCMLFSADMAVASEVASSFRSSAIRPGFAALIRLGLGELLARRRLIRYLVQADLKKKGSDTLLGNIWWVIDPLLQMVVYVILVTVIFNRQQPAYPLFLFCAILPWKWFNSSVTDGISSVVGMERLIKQIAFPKLVLPVASVMAGVANFFFGLIPLGVMMAIFYGDRASPWLLLIPVIAFVQLLFTLPVAIVLSALNVFYRDIGNLSGHLLRLAFYVSPGLYAIDLTYKAAEKYPILAPFILANPWNVLFTSYRDVIYDHRAPDWAGLGLVSAASLVLLAVAIIIFKRLEPTFAKVL